MRANDPELTVSEIRAKRDRRVAFSMISSVSKLTALFALLIATDQPGHAVEPATGTSAPVVVAAAV